MVTELLDQVVWCWTLSLPLSFILGKPYLLASLVLASFHSLPVSQVRSLKGFAL